MINEEIKFEQLYKEYQPKIYRYLLRLLGVEVAEDLTQDVFIKVNQALPDFKNESKLSTWIYRIATNTAIDRMRNATVKPASAEAYEESDIDVIVGGNRCSNKQSSSIEDQVVRQEMN